MNKSLLYRYVTDKIIITFSKTGVAQCKFSRTPPGDATQEAATLQTVPVHRTTGHRRRLRGNRVRVGSRNFCEQNKADGSRAISLKN